MTTTTTRVARVVDKARERDLEFQLISLVLADSLSKFSGLEFWNFKREDYRSQVIRINIWCWFNYAIELPKYKNKQYPLLPFQQEISDTLYQYKDIG